MSETPEAHDEQTPPETEEAPKGPEAAQPDEAQDAPETPEPEGAAEAPAPDEAAEKPEPPAVPEPAPEPEDAPAEPEPASEPEDAAAEPEPAPQPEDAPAEPEPAAEVEEPPARPKKPAPAKPTAEEPTDEPAPEADMGKVVLVGNAIIAQSGGPTAVINQSLVGAIKEMMKSKEIKGVYGARHGIRGMLAEDFVDLRAENPRSLEKIAKTPSAALGSVRMKPTMDDCMRLFKICQKRDVRYLFYIGGNDSAETAHIVASAAAEAGYDMRVYHIPKTIDNDLLVSDHCPGYGSAARFVALAQMGDQLDNRSLLGIKINVIMGRDAGFLTAASVLGQQRSDDGPHLVYVPERPFRADKFISDVKTVYDELGRCVVAVSEGIRDEHGEPVYKSGELDMHNNNQFSGSGALGDLLSQTVKERLGKDLRVRADTFGYLQRSFPDVVSKVDAEEALRVAREAVRLAVTDEHVSGSVAIKRTGTAKTYAVSYEWTPLESVAKNTRHMPDELINVEGNGVTEAFRDYALPLVGRLPRLGWLKGKSI